MDDLDFADDIALLARTYQQMQVKTTQLEESAAKLGLSASKVKTKSTRMNTTIATPIMLQTGDMHGGRFILYLPGQYGSALLEEQTMTSKPE